MLKTVLISIAIMVSTAIKADEVSFTISDGLDNAAVKSRIEMNVSKILTEINMAQKEGRNLNFSALDLREHVQQSLSMLWGVTPFICTDDDIIEHCFTTDSGYQVRNIPLQMKPTEESELDEDEYQEAVICFDKEGNVDKFYLAVPMNQYMNVINTNIEQTDLRRRQLILDYVEQYRTAYSQRNIDFINKVFSEERIFIIGKIETTKIREDSIETRVKYNNQNKKQYINSLRRVFQRVKQIYLHIDDIEVVRHPTYPYFYGVTIHQKWSSGGYHDSGYLFMLWDFTDEKAPHIHVTTWQPDNINGEPIPKEEIYGLKDFDI